MITNVLVVKQERQRAPSVHLPQRCQVLRRFRMLQLHCVLPVHGLAIEAEPVVNVRQSQHRRREEQESRGEKRKRRVHSTGHTRVLSSKPKVPLHGSTAEA